MKLFACQVCAQPLFFENETCEKCGHRLGFEPGTLQLLALAPLAGGLWQAAGTACPDHWHLCANARHSVCNWLVEGGEAATLCTSCAHNRTIPNLSDPAHLKLWRRMEQAKHRLIYTLLALNLPRDGLRFDILAPALGTQPVVTGHEEGLITLSLAEADDGEREKRRSAMGETYRTLLGHVRHEIGHFYWERLVRNGDRLAEFRTTFGDERVDYNAALQRHYATGAAADWQMQHVSAYASAHPWEDFAETIAHFLHIIDTLETARAFGLRVRPQSVETLALSPDIDFDPNRMSNVATLMDAWLPICFAVNAINRSMGQPDLYPFVLSPTAMQKLGFVAALVRAQSAP